MPPGAEDEECGVHKFQWGKQSPTETKAQLNPASISTGNPIVSVVKDLRILLHTHVRYANKLFYEQREVPFLGGRGLLAQ
jgi:hypothetical protein